MNENLWKIVHIFNIMKNARTFIILNLIWAFAYNIFIAPIAAGAFYTLGFTISPFISSIAMSGSSLIVVGFSNFIRCLRFDPSTKKEWQHEDFDKFSEQD